MLGRLHRLFLTGTALVPIGVMPVLANPLGSQVVGGSATVQGQGSQSVTVTQSSEKAIINWNTFNIGANETTKFVQPNSSSVALNRVTGGLGPSQIFGKLSANGQVYVVNPDGILIGLGAKIDTAGFLGTSHDIANVDFMAGRYNFTIPGRPDASVVNQGTVTAQSGGFAALVAPGVRNSGTITARLGTVTLASGNGFSLDFYGDQLITLGVSDSVAANVRDVATGKTLGSLVSNEGQLKANGGVVALSAVSARQIVDSVINNKGVIEANSIGARNGRIVLDAATAANKLAGTPTQTVKVSGKLSAAGKRKGTAGGAIQVTGEALEFASATLEASGRNGGGTVLIGGDTGGGNPHAAAASIAKAALETRVVPTANTVTVDTTSKIDASATDSGDGGKVVIWADGSTVFNGSISAHGGNQAGNGGFVEASGKHQLAFTGFVDTDALRGNGGTLLLDPQDVTIGNSGTWIITPASLQNALASSDVLFGTDATIGGNGDITVAQSFSWSSAKTLTFGAYRNIIINDGVTISNTGAGSINFGAGVTAPNGTPWFGNGTGTILFNGSGRINFGSSTGSVTFAFNPTDGYARPTNFNPYVTTNPAIAGQLRAFMWVNNVTDLQNINQNLTGSYVLANNIDASDTVTWNGGAGFAPIGSQASPFNGILTGVGGAVPFISFQAAINNLTISRPGPGLVGLFGFIGPAGRVSNIGLTNVSVKGGLFAGGLAGQNNGTIYQSYVTGSVTKSGPGVAGGLVGYNGDIGGSNAIIQSYSSASVFNSPVGPGSTGGLVGQNNALILDSYATGSAVEVATPLSPQQSVGGLVGHNNGVVLESYSTGFVIGVNTTMKGLVAANSAIIGVLGPTSVQRSYWDVQSTGQATDAPATGFGFIADSTGLTTAQLKSAVPTGFNTSVWSISPSVNNGYPYLRWQTATGGAVTLVQPTNGSGGNPPVSDPSNQIAFAAFSQQFGQINNFMQPIVATVAGSTSQTLMPNFNIATTGQIPTNTSSNSATQSALGIIENIKFAGNYYSPPNAHEDANFTTIIESLGLKENFNVTGKNYSSNKVTNQSSGGAATTGYIYPDGYEQNKDGWAECVSLVVALKGVTWETAKWASSEVSVVKGGAKSGDPIATFDENGKYTQAHAAIFVAYKTDNNGKILGWYMLDQNNVPGSEKPASVRYYDAGRSAAESYYSFSAPPG